MDGPGMSLFQGAGSIHINNSVQDRLDEQEQMQDQKRLHEELKHNLHKAFDDLQEDDDASSVNSSANFTEEVVQQDPCKEQKRMCNLPSYVESLNHCETPKTHYHQQHLHLLDCQKYYSPYGAGDGQMNYCQPEFKGHFNGINNYDGHQDHQNMINHEKLKLMYEMRDKEVKQLAMQLEETKSQAEMEMDSLRARLAASISDRDKAELSLQQAHQLLASSKHKILELEQNINNKNGELLTSEQEKEQLKLELRSANISLQEAQQRFHTVQVSHTHNNDALFREQQDRHRDDMDRLQEDLQKVKTRLDEKENEIKILERRCLEKDKAKEELLVEKGVIINRLTSELDTAQNRLMNGESVRLKEKISQLTTERNAAREQVKELGCKLQVTAHELVLYRNKLTNTQKEFEDWRNTLQQIIHDTLPDTAYIGESPSPGKLTALKDVLSRYRQQTQKLSTLQEEITKRDKKLDSYRKQESELSSELEERKGVEMQLNSRLAVLQNKLELLGNNTDSELLENYKLRNAQLQTEMEQLRSEHKALDLKYTEIEFDYEKLKKEKSSRASIVQEANADLLRELERCSTHLKDTLSENGELKTLYLKACSERDSKAREFKEIENKINSYIKEKNSIATKEKECLELLEKEKQHAEKLSSELASEREELNRANKRISELQKEFTDKQKKFNDKLNKFIEEERSTVRKELELCTQCDKYMKNIKTLEEELNKCRLRLATQENNEELMQELKNKADFFNNYIIQKYQKLQEGRHAATNTDEKYFESEPQTKLESVVQEAAAVQEDTLAARTNLMLKEKEIRDQIAEKYTLEIKTIEMNCSKKLKQMENDHMTNVNMLKTLLDKKAEEIETLKQFILSERTKISEILDSKENEISILIKENNTMQEEYQELREKATELKSGLEKMQAKVAKLKIDIERKSIELSNERERSARSRNELLQKMQLLDARTAQIEAQHELLKEKYKSVKRTALTYKEYATKKDEHVESELDRIKGHYKEIVSDLQNKIQKLITKRQQHEITEKINKMQANFNTFSDINKPL